MLEAWTSDQRDLRAAARDIARGVLAPNAAALESDPAAVDAVVPELGELGFWSLGYPEEHGGAEADLLTRVLVVEALAEASPSVAHRVGMHVLPALAALSDAHGPEDGIVPNLAADLASGAKVASYARVARCEGDSLVPLGDPMIFVCARRVWVARGAGEPVEMLGLRGVRYAMASIESVWQADDASTSRVRVAGDLAACAVALGTAQAATDAATRYAQERQQFGHPIAQFQAIQFKIADMATGLEAARRLTYALARALDAGESVDTERALHLRRFVVERAVRACDHALQIHGGYGYTREFPVERLLRAAKMLVPRSSGVMGQREDD